MRRAWSVVAAVVAFMVVYVTLSYVGKSALSSVHLSEASGLSAANVESKSQGERAGLQRVFTDPRTDKSAAAPKDTAARDGIKDVNGPDSRDIPAQHDQDMPPQDKQDARDSPAEEHEDAGSNGEDNTDEYKEEGTPDQTGGAGAVSSQHATDTQEKDESDDDEEVQKEEGDNTVGEEDGQGEEEPSQNDSADDQTDPGQEAGDLCPETSPHLVGNVTVNVHALSWEEINKLNPEVLPGGIYRVRECRSRHHVAIVIPYRERDSHLRVFLHHMLPILIRQQIDFGIYVIEQLPGSDFNRGILMNIGFAEAQQREPYPCYVFSDVDLWLENDRSIYGCPEQPRHLSVRVSKFHYRQQSHKLFGGIENFRTEHFKQVNGFSNLYFGWGGEDNDLYERVIKKGLRVIRPPFQYARYTMAKHKRASRDNPRKQLLKNLQARIDTEGLNTLQYDVKSVEVNPLYTKISVFVDQKELLKNVTLVPVAGQH